MLYCICGQSELVCKAKEQKLQKKKKYFKHNFLASTIMFHPFQSTKHTATRAAKRIKVFNLK